MKSLVEAVLEKQAQDREAMIRREIRAIEAARKVREKAQRQLDSAAKRIERQMAPPPQKPPSTGKCRHCGRRWPYELHLMNCTSRRR